MLFRYTIDLASRRASTAQCYIEVGRTVSQYYYSLLARAIIATRRDPAELRNVIFQFARLQLRRELFKFDNHVTVAEANRQIAALEDGDRPDQVGGQKQQPAWLNRFGR